MQCDSIVHSNSVTENWMENAYFSSFSNLLILISYINVLRSWQWINCIYLVADIPSGTITAGSTLSNVLFNVKTCKASFSKEGQKWNKHNNNIEHVNTFWTKCIFFCLVPSVVWLGILLNILNIITKKVCTRSQLLFWAFAVPVI